MSESITRARSIILHQAHILETLAERLAEPFEQAADAITSISSTGRLLVSGMGKAAWIAQKISSTFASLGVASFFVDPSDAIHGDLGRFTAQDLVLLLSNSGETNELLEILAPLRRVNCTLISITRDKNSTLGRNSDICIELGKIDECWPLYIAPTASSTAMLAVGDALSMITAWKRGFTREDYAALHPGGDIGRSLTRVCDLMRTGERHCVVEPNALTSDVIRAYTRTPGRPGCATVVDPDKRLLGIFTDGDLRRFIDSKSDFLSLPISETMSKKPKCISQNAYAKDALTFLTQLNIDQLVVVDDELKAIGLVDIQDLARITNYDANQ